MVADVFQIRWLLMCHMVAKLNVMQIRLNNFMPNFATLPKVP